ncbi:MAG: divergent polysaccharide deacetylase family protein [Litoreibacter sp.]|nr:divergent polysaccharide deacetylase family protein [Litoreibacter sp.]
MPGVESIAAPLIEITQASPGRSPLPTIEPEPEATEDDNGAEPEAEDSASSSASQPITIGVPSTPGVVTGRLPSVSEGTATEPAAVIQGSDALRAHAATPVETEGATALMSVVLIDAGEEGMPIGKLTDLAMPFSIAIDPVSPGAEKRAEAFRAAGVEVLTMPADLPASASASDITIAMASYFTILPESIALLDTLDGKLQSNRGLLDPVLSILQETGHGLVTFSRGLNSAQQAARRAEVENGAAFRVLDGASESPMTIKRTLDRAGFNAARDGNVILLGHTYPETVQTLLEWTLDSKSATLSIVPVSQILIEAPSS